MAAWRMFGGRGDRRPEFLNVGSRRYVEFHGRVPVEVDVIEDPDGPYYGWMDPEDDEPVMIQPNGGLFSVQFPYGPDAEVVLGRGRILRLRIEELT